MLLTPTRSTTISFPYTPHTHPWGIQKAAFAPEDLISIKSACKTSFKFKSRTLRGGSIRKKKLEENKTKPSNQKERKEKRKKKKTEENFYHKKRNSLKRRHRKFIRKSLEEDSYLHPFSSCGGPLSWRISKLVLNQRQRERRST